MSTDVKYRLWADSDKYDDTYRIDIHETGYTGGVQYKNIGAGKIKLEKKEGTLQQKNLYIDIQSDSNFEFLGFFQYDNRKHPVKLYKNDTLIWQGYIIAESYQEPYINPPYDVQIVATDGLSFLENYIFTSSETYLSRLQAISLCLSNLELSLEYEISIDLFDENMDTDRAMLAQAYFQGHIFNNENCSDVIESILPYGATITQKNNRWLIRRPYEDAEKTHFVYDSDGNYTGTASGENVLQMGSVSEGGIWPHGFALLSMEHAWSKVTIKNNYGKKLSFLKNYNFSLGNLNHWTSEVSSNVMVRSDGAGKTFVLIPGYVAPGTLAAVYQSVNVTETNIESGYFIFSLKVGLFYRASHNIQFRVSLIRPIIYTLHALYLTTDGWTETPNIIEQEINPTAGNFEMTSIEIFADNIPFTGTLKIELFQLESEVGGNPRTQKSMSVFFTDIQAITSETLQLAESHEEIYEIRENAAEAGEDMELKPIDLPQVANSQLVFENGNYYYNSGYMLTRLWKNNSGDSLLFTDILKEQLTSYRGQPRQIISGCNWRGAGLHLDSVAQHELNNNRKFIADKGTWNILEDTLDITWVEKPGSAAASGAEWILEDALWGDSGEIWMDDKTWKDSNEDLIIVNLSDPAPDGIFNITSEVGISNGDIITELWEQTWFGDKLYQDSTQISSVPYTFTGTDLYFHMSLFHSESFQTSFQATITGVTKTVQIIVTL